MNHQYSAFLFFSLSVFFNSLLVARSSLFPSSDHLPGRAREIKHPSSETSKIGPRCFFNLGDDSCLSAYGHSFFSPMNPLQMASLPGSHFTPDVPLGKFPSTQNILFWPRHHHRMPWTYAVSPAGSSHSSGSLLQLNIHACTFLLRL
jgi:hypothetical protein